MFPACLKLELFNSVPARLILTPNINSSTRIITGMNNIKSLSICMINYIVYFSNQLSIFSATSLNVFESKGDFRFANLTRSRNDKEPPALHSLK